MLESIIEKNKRYNLVSSIENAALSEMYCAKGNVDLIIMDIFTYQRESGLYVFGNNPNRTEVANFQNKVLRWQRQQGLR